LRAKPDGNQRRFADKSSLLVERGKQRMKWDLLVLMLANAAVMDAGVRGKTTWNRITSVHAQTCGGALRPIYGRRYATIEAQRSVPRC
jgi:hypothetical protein